ncbi:MAG: protein kinase [Verrucomicrobiota bacterium]
MSTEYSSGVKFKEGDKIKGYQIVKAFDPGGFAFAGKARAPTGRSVFFKKYKRPGGSSPWLTGFIAYQTELKRRIQADPAAKALCYEFIEFFEMNKPGGTVPLRAFYQVFEWVEGGKDLSKVLEEIKTNPASYDWNQRVIFARVMMAGINAIHKAGVIHTDIKPENFYLLPEPAIAAKYKLRVIDMDFSLLDGKQAPWHGHEGYVGTPGYLSPEHLAGKVPLKASDVFTLGLIIGQVLGGGHPAAPALDTYEDQVNNGRLKPVTVQKTIENVADLDFLNHVINGCLRQEANKRPTAEQVLMALNGRLAEWDGKRPNTATPAIIPSIPRPTSAPTVKPTPKPPVPVPAVSPMPPPSAPAPVLPPRPSPPAPTPATSSPAASAGVELIGPAGQKLKANIPTKFGRDAFKAWGEDYQKFISPEQFRLYKDASGQWLLEHCTEAKNATNANGCLVAAPVSVQPGMIITLGKTGKCPITLNLG